jgi:FkbM family methyltransferase
MILMREKLKPGMTVYDIGANLGEVTLFAADRVGGNGKVISFEPMKEAFEWLGHNVALNGDQDRVTCYNTALSDQKGELNLYAAKDPDPLGSYEDGLHTLFPSGGRNVLLHRVEVEKLDDRIEDLPPPDFIKIDVEGAELFVLRGAMATLQKFHPQLLIEINAESFGAAGYDQQLVFDLLTGLGYQLFDVRRRGKLKPLDTSQKIILTNIYCIWHGK